MKIFKDIMSGDELFSDTYPMKLTENCLWEIKGKYETRVDGEVHLEGSNASAEEAGDDNEAGSTSGIDVVLNHQLVETGFGKKKEFLLHLKDYMKKLTDKLKAEDRTDEVDEFQKNVNKVMKGVIAKFDDLQFFAGESMHEDGMIAMVEYKPWKDGETEEVPVVMFFKHGLIEEKC